MNLCELQYGFFEGDWQCQNIFAVQNVVNYFVKRHFFTIDACTAFDRVNIFTLLSEIIDNDVLINDVRVLIKWYTV